MGEHNSESQKLKKAERDTFAISESEKEKIIKPMMEAFKITEAEAMARAVMMKKFTLTHHKRLGKGINLVLDLIAEGSLVPANTVMAYDKPVSEYLIRFDVAQTETKNDKLVMHVNFEFMGKKFRMMISNDKFAQKKFGTIMSSEEIAKAKTEAKD